jgi:hypothetical protein
MKPIHKFNNGNGATLCNCCYVIINNDYTDDLLCDRCELFINERVIEELEALKLCNGVCIDLEIEIDEIIKELKQ